MRASSSRTRPVRRDFKSTSCRRESSRAARKRLSSTSISSSGTRSARSLARSWSWRWTRPSTSPGTTVAPRRIGPLVSGAAGAAGESGAGSGAAPSVRVRLSGSGEVSVAMEGTMVGTPALELNRSPCWPAACAARTGSERAGARPDVLEGRQAVGDEPILAQDQNEEPLRARLRDRHQRGVAIHHDHLGGELGEAAPLGLNFSQEIVLLAPLLRAVEVVLVEDESQADAGLGALPQGLGHLERGDLRRLAEVEDLRARLAHLLDEQGADLGQALHDLDRRSPALLLGPGPVDLAELLGQPSHVGLLRREARDLALERERRVDGAIAIDRVRSERAETLLHERIQGLVNLGLGHARAARDLDHARVAILDEAEIDERFVAREPGAAQSLEPGVVLRSRFFHGSAGPVRPGPGMLNRGKGGNLQL